MTWSARQIAWTGLHLLALGVCAARTAAAQRRWVRAPDAAYLAAGVSGIATAELDEQLAASGYPSFGRTAAAASLGGYWALPNGVLLGGEWHGLDVGVQVRDGREVGLGGGYGTIGIGYAVRLSPRVRLYPRLGLGGGALGLWVESAAETTVGFDEALVRPSPSQERARVLSRGSTVADLGGGVELLPRSRGRGPLIGVRFGYLVTPFVSGWRRDDVPVSGGPDATLAGPYVRVVVGVGRTR